MADGSDFRLLVLLFSSLLILFYLMREKNLETCLVISTGLIIAWFVYRLDGLLMVATAIGIIGAFFNALATWINWLWYKIAEVMGAVMSRVILSLVFFLFLFPIALVYRLFNDDGLQLTKKEDEESYWTDRPHSFTGKDLKDMW